MKWRRTAPGLMTMFSDEEIDKVARIALLIRDLPMDLPTEKRLQLAMALERAERGGLPEN